MDSYPETAETQTSEHPERRSATIEVAALPDTRMHMTWWNRVRLTPFLLTVPALLVAQTQTQRPASDVPVFDRETPDRYAADVPAHIAIVDGVATLVREGDRKSKRLNSSHTAISD